MTETARQADYVLPAASQYEKPEATYFNFEFPDNCFQLRHPLMEPLPGTLPEAEIWARLVEATGLIDEPTSSPFARPREGDGVRTRPRLRARRPRTPPSRALLRTCCTGPSARRSRTASAPLRPSGDSRFGAR